MTFDCKDLERALAVPELLPDAREHAKVCDACRRELWLWSEMSDVAPGLREEWETPDLWPKIRQSIAAEQKKAVKPRRWYGEWRLWSAVAAALAIAVSLFYWNATRKPAATTTPDGDFLTVQALRDVEKAETAYRASIDKLTRLAETKLSASANPAAVSAREKLMVLDNEIDNLRATVAQNRFNAQLQTELASLYRDKQDTLKEILQRAQ